MHFGTSDFETKQEAAGSARTSRRRHCHAGSINRSPGKKLPQSTEELRKTKDYATVLCVNWRPPGPESVKSERVYSGEMLAVRESARALQTVSFGARTLAHL